MEFGEYYIAYFDVLGCKSYFAGDDNAALSFLYQLKGMVACSLKAALGINNSKTLNTLPEMKIEYRLFSDNVALYLKATDSPLEIIRLLTFLQVIAELQREVLFGHGLLLRGGATAGKFYSDETLIMGPALIEAVKLEETGIYPRILIDNSIDKAVSALINNLFPNDFLTKDGMLAWVESLVFGAVGDKKPFLNYLSVPELEKVYPVLKNGGMEVLERLEKDSPEEYERTRTAISSDVKKQIHDNLARHQKFLYGSIQKYCGYSDVNKDDKNAVALKNKIIRKYKWLAVFHNYMCGLNKFEDCLVFVKYTYDPITLDDYMEILDPPEKSGVADVQFLKKDA